MASPGTLIWCLTVPAYSGGKGYIVGARLTKIGDLVLEYRRREQGRDPENLAALAAGLAGVDPSLFVLPWDAQRIADVSDVDTWASFVYLPTGVRARAPSDRRAVLAYTREPVMIPGRGPAMGVLCDDGSVRLLFGPDLDAFLAGNPLLRFRLPFAVRHAHQLLGVSSACFLASSAGVVCSVLLSRLRRGTGPTPNGA